MLAATTFTVAHSVTFILAALGLVHVPASLVEPVIALSIAVVAGLYLWRIWQRGSHATDLETVGHGRLGLDAAGRTRLAVVFCFGLVHGLGFASALGIDEAFSWTLLSSLFVFNLGIESVQLAIILVVFPLLALLRRRAPLAGLSATGAIAAVVCAMGLVWFVQRELVATFHSPVDITASSHPGASALESCAAVHSHSYRREGTSVKSSNSDNAVRGVVDADRR